MNIQSDIVRLIEEKEPQHYELILNFLKESGDNAIPQDRANSNLLMKIESIIIEEGDYI